MSAALAVLVPRPSGPPVDPPEAFPLGRAALAAPVDVVFVRTLQDGMASGLRAIPGAWEVVDGIAVCGAYDRFPSKGDPDGHTALVRGLRGGPLINPVSLTALCRDKLACQRHLEARGVAMPEVVDDPAVFADALSHWGAGFVKPRFGAFGAGVSRVVAGARVPATVHGDAAASEPALLQRAVAPPDGFAGVSVRALVQRLPGGGWALAPMVARRDRVDPVVNVARGAEARLADDVLGADTLAVLARRVRATAEALADHPDGALLAELGVDLVIDPDGTPWVIEVNGRPRGRLEVLAERDPVAFRVLHLEACLRPLSFLASITR